MEISTSTSSGEISVSDDVSSTSKTTCSSQWSSRMHKWIHNPTNRMILKIAHAASTHPKLCVFGIFSFSIAMVLIGFSTNFYIEDDETKLFTPFGSRSLNHFNWIDDESGFLKTPRQMEFTIHADGNNVLGQEGPKRVFQVLDAIRNLEDYSSLCSKSMFGRVDYETGQTTCPIESVTQHWNHSLDYYQSNVFSDEDAIQTMSKPKYLDQEPVDIVRIIGKTQYDNTQNQDEPLLTSAQSYKISIYLPSINDEVDQESEDLEEKVLEAVHEIRDEWKNEEGNEFRLEFYVVRSFADEFNRAILGDLPLVPLVFTVMSIFCVIYFSKKDKVKSRGMLGFGAVVTVLLSLMTSYGLMFIIGVPLSSMTQILPFIMFGIGLDDIFIIFGEYERIDPSKNAVDRIQETIDRTGISVFLTTLTSVLAFASGCLSSIPIVRWLCLYAFPTIITIFLYSITFFVALLVLDEQRMKNNCNGCLICCKVGVSQKENNRDGSSLEEGREEPQDDNNDDKQKVNMKPPLVDRFMHWYGTKLMQKWVKIGVLLVAAGMLAGLAYSATLLKVHFNFVDVLPSDSYVADFVDVTNNYIETTRAAPFVFFRFENQSDPDTQDAMESYIDQLVKDVDAIEVGPSSFWLTDFKTFTNTTTMKNKSFSEQMDSFLKDPVFSVLHGPNIVRDEKFGNITASRCVVDMGNVDFTSVDSQITALESQRSVSAQQPLNAGHSDWSFFTLSSAYFIWEFYAVVVDELIYTTVLSIVMVTLASLIFMPHWSGFLYVGPFIAVLYIDLMGVLQLAQVDISPVPYVGLVMSVGLMVDYIVHMVLRYLESKETSREAKVIDTLCSMGASVFVGGVSTLLGVIPLSFSSTDVFFTIFVIFCGLVVLGMFHGLVVLPVVLSIVGPVESEPKK